MVLWASLAFAGTIEVEMTEFHSDEGVVHIALFNSADGYPSNADKIFRAVKTSISTGAVTVKFEDIPYGTYALSVHHDENENDKIDLKFLVLPKEGLGASNNASGFMGPPKFKDAAFAVDEAVTTQKIRIVYL